MPVYIWDLGKTGLGNFYGFPEQAGYEGIKVAMHHCKDEKLVVSSPTTIDRVVAEEEVEMMRDMLRQKIRLESLKLVVSKFVLNIEFKLFTTKQNKVLVKNRPRLRHQLLCPLPVALHNQLSAFDRFLYILIDHYLQEVPSDPVPSTKF